MSDASFFRTLWPEARSHMDDAFGESVTISPRTRKVGDPNARLIPDTTRAITTTIGIWDDTPSDGFPQSRVMPDKTSHEVSDGDVVLTIAKARLPFAPLQNDIVTRNLTGETYAVAKVSDDAETEWALDLSSRKA